MAGLPVPLNLLCRAILFDMDGTLVDSTAVVERVWSKWAERHHINAQTIMPAVHGRRSIEVMRQFAPHLANLEHEALLLDTEESHDTAGVIPIAGATAVLSSLPPDTWAVVTSATRELAETRLRFAGLPIPPVLVSAEDVQHGKPHPEGYQLAATRLHIPTRDCLVVEDTLVGLEAGLRAGTHLLAVGLRVQRDIPHSTPWIRDFCSLRIATVADRLSIQAH